MLTRIITGIIALAIFIPILFLSNTIIFDIAIAFISFMGAFELLKCVGIIKKYLISVPSMLVSFLVPLLARYAENEFIWFIIIVYLFYLLYAAVFKRKQTSTNDIALCFFATIFMIISFTSIIITKQISKLHLPKYGDLIYPLIFIGAWATDTFAYFTGKLIGKRKFFPDISPNKTLEGAIGGIIFCSASFILYGYIITNINMIEIDAKPNYILLACAGVATSVVSQLGDLSMSAIKRNYGLKNYGSIFPGHGGILDRFDSVMAAAPFIMIMGMVLSKFTEFALFI